MATLSELVGESTEAMVHRWAGNLLRDARTRRGWTQRDLAAAAGVAQPTVAKIESGAMQPSFPTLYRLIAAAGYDIRTRLAPADDHDQVLDARAERDPASQGAREAARDSLLEQLADGGS